MAQYTDIDELRREWGVKQESVTTDLLRRAAEIAYAKINSVLNSTYTVPFTESPMWVEVVAISDLLTKHYALLLGAKRGGPKVKKGDMMQGELLAAKEWLEGLVAGTMDIVGLARKATDAEHTMSDYTRIFDLDPALSHLPDRDYLDDVSDERL